MLCFVEKWNYLCGKIWIKFGDKNNKLSDNYE